MTKKNLTKLFHQIQIFALSLIFINPLSATSISDFYNYKKTAQEKKIDLAVNNYIASLSLSQKISQIFLVNIEGNKNYSPIEDSSKIPQCEYETEALVPGGMLLFSYNIGESPRQMMEFIDSIKIYCEKNNICPPYIATDQEGGIVNRLYPLTTYLPSNKKIAQFLSPQDALKFYEFQAEQMQLLGFNMNLAPVCESLLPSNLEFLGSRSYGSAEKAIVYSSLAVKAYENKKIAAVLKHFPGNSNVDPHSSLPEISANPQEAQKFYLMPFSMILLSNPEAVLMSHAKTSFLDPNTPSCFSNEWIENILRKKMNFKGLVISDDIFMAALAKNGFAPETAAIKAIEAGVNIIMLSEKTYSLAAKNLISFAEQNLEFKSKLLTSIKKVIKFKLDYGILSLQKDDKGNYFVKNPEFAQDLDERLEKFTNIKSKADSFYTNKFIFNEAKK